MVKWLKATDFFPKMESGELGAKGAKAKAKAKAKALANAAAALEGASSSSGGASAPADAATVKAEAEKAIQEALLKRAQEMDDTSFTKDKPGRENLEIFIKASCAIYWS